MDISKTSYLLCIILVAVSTFVVAEENDFATTSSAMVEQLSASPPTTVPGEGKKMPKVRLRGIPDFDNPPAAAPAPELRAIQRISHNNQGQAVTETVQIPQEQKVARVNLKIEFDINSYSIRPESFSLLAELGKALSNKKLQGKTFFINGHTDADGSNGHNLTLSLNRAQSVKQFVVANYPVSGSQLTVIGYGESIPISTNETRYGKQMNRRVEIVVK